MRGWGHHDRVNRLLGLRTQLLLINQEYDLEHIVKLQLVLGKCLK